MASHGLPRISKPKIKTEEARIKELTKIKNYRELVDTAQAKIQKQEYSTETLGLTSKILTQNPEYYTIWNHRRRILRGGLFTEDIDSTRNLISNDLRFLVPLLREFPKCYWIWNYRTWLLQESNDRLPARVARAFWLEELGLVSKMLTLDSRNFHGWGYRRLVVSQLESPALNPASFEPQEEGTEGGENPEGASMTEEEFAYTRKMIVTDLSNFSAWHRRSKLIPRLLTERDASEETRQSFLNDEFRLIQEALIDPYDQSLWFYHKFLMSNILPPTSTGPTAIAPTSTSYHRVKLQQEIDNIRELLDDTEDCKWAWEALVVYTMALQSSQGEGTGSGGKSSHGEIERELRGWIENLKRLDPMRIGRWEDLSAQGLRSTF
ncbi:MAG: Rab geranylgeranyltransferase [Sclerophora amabilis]|nr:MAG: Rab geranylgeranyltransferase [Sclerophora amabilis]